jgi:hypothetical protein
MYPYERSAYEEAVALVVDRTDEPEIAAAWAAGRAMSESDAAAFALAAVGLRTGATRGQHNPPRSAEADHS